MVAFAVLTASLLPGQSGVAAAGATPFGVDKIVHVIGYACLTYTVAGAVRARTAGRLAAVVVAVAAFGAGVELVQPVVGRTASPLDALANLAGAVAGALLWALSRSRLSG